MVNGILPHHFTNEESQYSRQTITIIITITITITISISISISIGIIIIIIIIIEQKKMMDKIMRMNLLAGFNLFCAFTLWPYVALAAVSCMST